MGQMDVVCLTSVEQVLDRQRTEIVFAEVNHFVSPKIAGARRHLAM
jgi:hypothetical protein